MVSLVLLGGLFFLIFMNVPIGVAIGGASLGAILVGDSLSTGYLIQSLVSGVDSFPIMAIPLFILAGELMGSGGISRRILDFCSVFFGRMWGGLAIVTVVVCMFFSAVCGSGPATVAAIGPMVIKPMVDRGYGKAFTLGLIATGGCIGVILPPSIPMIIYGVSTQNSISDMFLGGVIPGILVGLLLITWSYFYCKKQGWKGDDTPFSWARARRVTNEAKWALINPIIILGGIYGGIFTPTEAAAVAVTYAVVCGIFIHKELTFRTILTPIANACSTTGTSMAILGCATAFTRILTVEQIPTMMTVFMLTLTENRIVMLLLINLLLLFVGLFMDTTPAMIVLSPILLPVAMSFGLHPIHFGLIMVVNLSIGFITPPVGVCLFVASRVSDESLELVTKGAMPFVMVMLFALMLITYIPELTMFLPNLLK